jgi:hypothetical protein
MVCIFFRYFVYAKCFCCKIKITTLSYVFNLFVEPSCTVVTEKCSFIMQYISFACAFLGVNVTILVEI